MSGPAAAARRGRRGRRTARMIRIAGERVSDLFALAESETSRRPPGRADRYVALARKVGARYNVRLLPEYRELYCRGCSSYWVEGRTVRTRLRAGRRVRTCLVCGRVRRVRIALARLPAGSSAVVSGDPPPREVAAAEVAFDADEDESSSPEEDA
ncbi:MAG TPA: ribonuclease P [Thermoplasmata archaeon]|nr:ribonuclease P [Thermoplasmata archaeon]